LDVHAPHREFLAAIADGETALVPQSTLEHVRGCPDCMREIHAHEALTARLRRAGDRLQDAAHETQAAARLRWVAIGVAAALIVAIAGGGWLALSRPDPVQAAIDASSQPLQFQSSDPGSVAQWCRQASGRSLPAIQLDGMQLVGARMDRGTSTDVVTVTYSAPDGARVTVGWLEGQVPAGSGVEDMHQSGHELLIVHSRIGTAVIMGSSTDAMWQAAAAIEAA